MAYTVFIYENNAVQDQKSFDNIKKSFEYIGTLDLQTKIERCILDDGNNILFDLKRDENGNLTT